MTHYEREAISFVNHNMPKHAAVHALLGVAYELRTTNMLALNHTLRLMVQEGRLGTQGEELLREVDTDILERLGYSAWVTR